MDTPEQLSAQCRSLLAQVPKRGTEKTLDDIRKFILLHGIPNQVDESIISVAADEEPLRPLVWQALLRLGKPDVNRYVELVKKGPSAAHAVIVNDTFRTFHASKDFTRRVPAEKLIRGLNAYVHSHGNESSAYIQGLNAQLAPFLYVMDEIYAFECFERFVSIHCPLYSTPELDGVHAGCELLDEILPHIDEQLARHLSSHGLIGRIYAFPSVLSLSSCTPPLPEVIKLWDLFLAFGVHLNILCVAAQLVLLREKLLAEPSPMKLLRKFPSLDASVVASLAIQLVKQLPHELYERLVRHPFDESLSVDTPRLSIHNSGISLGRPSSGDTGTASSSGT